MGLAGASIGGRGAIALQHRAGPPAGQPHEIGLSPALSEPLVGDSVAKLMWMEVGQAGLMAAAPQHLHGAPGGQLALEPQPQPWQGRVLVPSSDAEVAIQRHRRRASRGGRGRPAGQQLGDERLQVGAAHLLELAPAGLEEGGELADANQVAGHGAVGEVLGVQMPTVSAEVENALVRWGVVGVTGLEPVTSSL